MRRIVKQIPPQSLIEHQKQNNADYDNYLEKDELRDCLVAEQGAICCYCLERIRPTNDRMKIEHWRCQANYPEMQLNYDNLLAACRGGEGFPPYLQHCDTKKGDLDLERNPAATAYNIDNCISFLSDGTVESSDPVLNSQLVPVLNLNLLRLKRNRKAVLDGFKDSLGDARLTTTQINNELAKWSARTNGDFTEHCQVVIYWLQKRLARP